MFFGTLFVACFVMFQYEASCERIEPQITTYVTDSYSPSAEDTAYADAQQSARDQAHSTLRASSDVSTELGAHHQLGQLGQSAEARMKSAKYNNDAVANHASSISDAAAKSALLNQKINAISGMSSPTCTTCSGTDKYRTISGKCNNVRRCNWGTAQSTFRRLLSPTYDGAGQPLSYGTVTPFVAKSGAFDSEEVFNSNGFTAMVMQMGQYYAHDFSATPAATLFSESGEPLDFDCCTTSGYEDCLKLVVSRSRCTSIFRTAPGVIDRDGVYTYGDREQMNMATAYLDASPIYGSTDAEHSNVRDSGSAKLKVWTFDDQPVLPTSANQYCDGTPDATTGELNPCFVAGDTRPNVHYAMMLTHNLILREHNRLVDEITPIAAGRGWDQDTIFNEVRRILIAYLQVIAYEQYLPLIIGTDMMNLYGLNTDSRSEYDDNTDAGIYNSFATAAFRFGHSQIYQNFEMIDHLTGAVQNQARLKSLFFNPDKFYRSRFNFRRYILGLTHEKATEVDGNFITDIQEPLFLKSGRNVGTNDKYLGKGLDLPAINILRGRDHGLPPYGAWKTYINSFDNSGVSYLNSDAFDAYGGVDNADLYVAGLQEEHLAGATVGKTFAHIIAFQFRQSMYGDRFFYNHKAGVASEIAFTDAQVAELKKINMAQLICRNANMTDQSIINDDTFHQPTEVNNPRVPCTTILQNYPDIATLLG